ncbi:cupin domain-containing protein [Streptomyces sp. NPDC048385]|uniref:cupin domain-containing protein n=1 Tax=unclassified Streptomyces TaxID=2593676 RepID=UPI00342C23FC
MLTGSPHRRDPAGRRGPGRAERRVDRGACHLTPHGSEPILLSQGDIALLPSGIGHAVSDAGERPVRPFGEIFGGTLEGMSPAGLIVEGGGPAQGPAVRGGG